MRDATDIVKDVLSKKPINYEITYEECIEIAKTAQSEAIREAARVVTISFYNYDNEGNRIRERGMGQEVNIDGSPESDYVSADKQSILQLLDKIK